MPYTYYQDIDRSIFMENIIIDKKILMKKLESLVSWEDWVEIDKIYYIP